MFTFEDLIAQIKLYITICWKFEREDNKNQKKLWVIIYFELFWGFSKPHTEGVTVQGVM